ncbi:cobyrinic acid a,c-diamide synthase [Bradyrhizobium sp. JR3.5]
MTAAIARSERSRAFRDHRNDRGACDLCACIGRRQDDADHLALARAYRNRGLKVQCLKSGPDYIDPAFHAVATGRASVNIDSWAMSRDAIVHLANRGADADLVLAEGSMGLFDGVATRGVAGTGATADIAEMMGWPVLLVIDPSGQAQTAAAVAAGLRDFRPGVRLAGVVLNRVASPRHEALVRSAMAGAGIPVLGALPRYAEIALPKRHLGLVQAEEQAEIDALIDEAARFVVEHVDLDAVLKSARAWSPQSAVRSLDITPPGQRIALARDAAFSFVYPHMLEAWRAAGAEIVTFSPLADEAPDADADVCWLPGGYPELHAARLASNKRFLGQLRAFAETKPVHGECGGYMVLGAALTDAEGVRHEMASLLGLLRPAMPSGACIWATGSPSLPLRCPGMVRVHVCAATNFTIRRSSHNPTCRLRWCAMRPARSLRRPDRGGATQRVHSSI